ncbi:MAG: hypothetical protein QXW35_00170 [Candidatus Aenigmatarchaeota archaeon]
MSEYIPLGISREEIVNDCTNNPGHLSNILNSDLIYFSIELQRYENKFFALRILIVIFML